MIEIYDTNLKTITKLIKSKKPHSLIDYYQSFKILSLTKGNK